MIQYALECVGFQLLFLIIYDVFLKKETFFQWNRVYLIGTYVLSLVLPWVKIEALKTNVSKPVVAYPEFLWNTNNLEVVVTSQVETPFVMPWKSILIFGGMVLALLFFLFKLYQIHQLRQKGEVHYLANFTQIIIKNSEVAFSFFRSIFLGDKVITQDHESIIQHELVHIKQGHSYDLVFFEILKIVNWFNPLVYVYQSRIAELHEFIADAHVAKTHKKEQYQLLLSQVFQTEHISFINPFFKSSLIKKRIVMLQKSRSKKIFQLKYLLLVPLLLGMLFYTSMASESELGLSSNLNDADDVVLIKKVQAEIDKEVFEFGSLKAAYYNFSPIAKDQNAEFILSKEEYFKLELFHLMFFDQIVEDTEKKGGTLLNVERHIMKPTSVGYIDYVNHKKAMQILDDKVKISISAYDHDVILLDSAADYPENYTQVKVKDAKDLSGDEIRDFNSVIDDISKNNRLESIVLTDGTFSFKIYQKKYTRVEEYEASALPQEIITRDGSTITYRVVNVQHMTSEEIAKRKELVDEMLNSDTYDTLVITDGKMKTIIGGKTVPNDEVIVSEIEGMIDVPFSSVDEVPVFPGCENNSDKRACFQEKMYEHISKNFNYPLEAQEQGIQGRVNILFIIDEMGNITNLRMRGPDKLLEAEAARIIGRLPKMKPGKQKGKNVRVPFSIPITFKLQVDIKEVEEKIELNDVLGIPFSTVEEAPIFPGCENASDKRACFQESIYKHISKNFRYPQDAQDLGIQGKVNTLFVIGKDGSINDMRLRGPSKLLEEETKRILLLLPNMKPGKQKGKEVNVPFSVPVTFRLQGATNFELIPESLKNNYPNESKSIEQLNTLLKERERLLKTSNSTNPIIESLENQINALRTSIENNIVASKN